MDMFAIERDVLDRQTEPRNRKKRAERRRTCQQSPQISTRERRKAGNPARNFDDSPDGAIQIRRLHRRRSSGSSPARISHLSGRFFTETRAGLPILTPQGNFPPI